MEIAGADVQASRAAAASPAAAVGISLLAAQEFRNGADRDAAARRRATAMLDELGGLQAELAGARADPGRLARLAALAAGEDGADPGLRAAVRAVALRVRLELARRADRAAEMQRTVTVP